LGFDGSNGGGRGYENMGSGRSPSRGRDEILEDLARSVENWDMALVRDTVGEAFVAGISPVDMIREGLSRGMDRISVMFDEGRVYLPQIVAASHAVDLAMSLIAPRLSSCDSLPSAGTIVMGTVRGDIHEIGKDVCCAMLRGAGYNVVDIGSDRVAERFTECALKSGATAVGASALMTTTLVAQGEVVLDVRRSGIGAKVLVGGAPCCQEWADEIGADGYSANGSEIVDLVRRIARS
jgi:methanogenic corrinoid protein MtbC1